MKATVILVLLGLLAIAFLSVFGGPTAAVVGLSTKAVAPAWMTVSGAALIALGSAVRRYVP